MDNTYQYRGLSRHGAIRLLSIHPSPEINDPVVGYLLHTTLGEMNDDMIDSYTALSYVWGSSTEVIEIHIDDKSLHVTPNLDAALRHLRDHTRRRLVWADAICINQQDNSEKGKQVSQMGEVYKMARRTVIYLGESTELSEMYFEDLAQRKSRSDDSPKFPNINHLGDILQRPW